MTFDQALPLARDYAKVRRAVRKALLTRLRALDERQTNSDPRQDKLWVLQGNMRGKLYNFPSDLTDQRLLDWLDAFAAAGFH